MDFPAAVDPLIVCVYILCIILAGLWFSRKSRRTSRGYFLAGKSLTWPVIGASLFASNISTVHLVGLAESGYVDGIVWGNFEWFACFELLILAFVFVPFYLRTGVTTLPEFLEKRYDSRSRIVLAIFSILAALFMHIGVSFYAGAIVLKAVLGLDLYVSIVVIAAATGIYTIVGGLRSVVITETLQTVILIAGSASLTILAIQALPAAGIDSYAALKEAVDPDRLRAISFDPSRTGFTFMDMLSGHLVLGIWYWCTDQTIAQRTLGAKNEAEAKMGAIFAGFLKVSPVFIMVLPGILAFALFGDQITETKSVLSVLILELMPVGLKGVMVAALLAAVMSSVAAALNSCSTLVVHDVIERIRPGLPDRTKISVGRATGVIVLLMATVWSPFLGSLGGIFQIINQMFAIFSPAVVAVFIWGIFYKKGTGNAAFWTLIGSTLIALGAFIIEKYIPIQGVQNYISNPSGLGINWLQQTFIQFLLSSAMYFPITWCDSSQPGKIPAIESKASRNSKAVKWATAALVITIVSLYVIFY